jgi:hypothetical protein
MRRLTLAILLLVTLTGCEPPPTLESPFQSPKIEKPTVNLPLALRQSNWRGSQREGSCAWASMISLLRWQGHYQIADWIRANYGNGARPVDTAQKLDRAGVRYAYVTNGDVNFLEWSCRTRRGCAITVQGGKHMICLVYLDDQWAAVLDNNSVENFIWVPRETLIAEWKASYGWAITPIYDPAAPLPQ